MVLPYLLGAEGGSFGPIGLRCRNSDLKSKDCLAEVYLLLPKGPWLELYFEPVLYGLVEIEPCFLSIVGVFQFLVLDHQFFALHLGASP